MYLRTSKIVKKIYIICELVIKYQGTIYRYNTNPILNCVGYERSKAFHDRGLHLGSEPGVATFIIGIRARFNLQYSTLSCQP